MCRVWRADNSATTTKSRSVGGVRGGVSGKRRRQNAVVHVNSVLLAFLNTGSVVGSLTGSLVIGSGQLPSVGNPSATTDAEARDGFESSANRSRSSDNGTPTTEDRSVCGVGHCPYIAEHIRAFASPDPLLVLVVGAVFLSCVVAAAVLTVVLRPLPSDRPCSCSCCSRRRHQVVVARTDDRDGKVSLRTRIAGTLRLLTDTRLLLLIPTIVMMGVITSFAVGAFNQVLSLNVYSVSRKKVSPI